MLLAELDCFGGPVYTQKVKCNQNAQTYTLTKYSNRRYGTLQKICSTSQSACKGSWTVHEGSRIVYKCFINVHLHITSQQNFNSMHIWITYVFII